MAESSLSIGYPDLQAAVGRYLGYTSDPSDWAAKETAEIDRLVQAGYRQFLYPPAMQEVQPGYEWAFLRPTATLNTTADQGEVDCPDDFGRLVGDMYYEPQQHVAPIIQVSQGRILAMRQASSTAGRPSFVATRYKQSTGATGQRLELMLYPTPDAAYALTYMYEAYTGKLTADNPYPLGGMRYAEVLTASCLAIAERRVEGERGIEWDEFVRLLIDAVARDSKMGAKYFGNMGDPETGAEFTRNLGEHYPITYKGETW